MEVIANIFLVGGALGAAVYCLILSRRLQKFTNLEGGIGSAVAVLSAQVDDLTRAVAHAQERAGTSAQSLAAASDRADNVVKRLELLLATMHDLPEPAGDGAANGTAAGSTIFIRGAARPEAGK